ncbi:SDR family oxidoreductase [Bacteroides xylanisolvens]|uniref:SDR family oxidoreductase n=1 Tax=Bacteroides xylanisolvens TaxID=371601 RepID=A0AAW4SX54_9BACE|nr:SDR family oxidoreductase [Bacteroides xylanisolvens]MCA4532281.1 SDR family oxidoreductase [Bacteroides xylanisolvens]MCA4550461.1 SDR family oxidoreductase [Bacteroides xylanisolvens]MCA4563906.1 SDR family oxidoreductase [Bacteroides xylanisolvens]MCA4568533.1 SDR family oxidoreductase [Bacteroides xylanisolvens]MCA4599259.1 SDR family oxidoreductase [Bacteroides xylanisolvens]
MGRTIIVTGGANGIGRCITEHFASEGDTVYILDKEAKQTVLVANEMQHKGWNVTGYIGDIADKQTLLDFAGQVLSEHPEGIHCIINNACLMQGGVLDGCEYEDFLYVQRVGVAAPFMLAKLFKDHFIGLGSIVNISSTRAFQSQPNTESYTAAKGGITALTHALAVSLSGIARVNSITPGWIETGTHQETAFVPSSESDYLQHPSQRVGNSDDIARAVAFLCDERNSFINGENITTDGGMSKLMVYHNDCGWEYKAPIVTHS